MGSLSKQRMIGIWNYLLTVTKLANCHTASVNVAFYELSWFEGLFKSTAPPELRTVLSNMKVFLDYHMPGY